VPVVVVTDSAAGLPADLAEPHGIRVVPLHILHEGHDFREGVDALPTGLWRSTTSSTSAASPRELQVAYEEALAASAGDGVVAIHLSRQLSSTWDAARQAVKTVGDGVRVVDSATAGMGLGLVVLAAARAAAAGASRDEVHKTAVEAAGRGSTLVFVDQLDSLRRGGRIGTAAALLGSALAIKPVLEIVDGKLVLREKLRTATKAINRLVECSITAAGTSGVAVAVQHLDAPERASDTLGRLHEHIPNVTASYLTQIGAVLGLHLGPGTLAVSLLPD
jgi:DegV family protein with EDD domain